MALLYLIVLLINQKFNFKNYEKVICSAVIISIHIRSYCRVGASNYATGYHQEA